MASPQNARNKTKQNKISSRSQGYGYQFVVMKIKGLSSLLMRYLGVKVKKKTNPNSKAVMRKEKEDQSWK